MESSTFLENLVQFIEKVNGKVGDVVWGPPVMALLAGTGLYLTIRLGFFQFTHLRLAWKQSFGRSLQRTKETEKGSVTSFQAVAAAMAGTIGVGNIAGVSTAIALGGPGAIFWMWMIALVGMATKFAEATLAVKYREVSPDGRVSGGVMYYIERGLGPNWKWLAGLYAFLAGVAAFGIGNMVQANTMAQALATGFNVPEMATGIGVVVLVGLVTMGGIKRIAKIAEGIVPTMVVIYVVGAVIILALNLTKIPAAFGEIFYYAFNPAPAAGGFAGSAVALSIRYGIARGIFSNEAGLGASSIVHAQATNHPVRQGMWGIWEVFIDTIIVATMTGLVIIVTGAITSGSTSAELASEAFTIGLPGSGGILVLLCLILFSYTTMLTWNFYGEKSWEYLFGTWVITPYRIIFLGFLFVGAIGGLQLVWAIADTLNGIMAIPNLIALLALGGVLAKTKNSYMTSLRSGTPEPDEARSADGGR